MGGQTRAGVSSGECVTVIKPGIILNSTLWGLLLLETAGRTGLTRHLNLVSPVRQKVFLEFWIEQFQFEEVGAEFFSDRRQRPLRLLNVDGDCFGLERNVQIFFTQP